MDKSKSIINFYIIANKLKQKIRTGWMEVEISKDRLESVAEHIYGCLILAIGIESEYVLNLDMYKVLKMIALHELEETIMKDYTIRDNITPEEKIKEGKKCVHQVTEGLIKQKEIEDLLDEFNERKTKEAIFCYHIDKIECDFQAKMYDLENCFPLEKAIEDIKYYDGDTEEVRKKVKNASDVWIEFDKKRYDDDDIFMRLINEIQKLKKL